MSGLETLACLIGWLLPTVISESSLMPTREDYEAKIATMAWPELQELWNGIKNGETPGWDPGKAFEYLVLRVFDFDGAEVRWPYPVSLHGQQETVEEIDGSVRVGGLYCLIESKDEERNIAIEPIAKLRNQLLRRPAGTFGMVFSTRGYTEGALQLAQFSLPQAILLWTGAEIEYALIEERICQFLERKYRRCVEGGIVDHDITKGEDP